MLKTARRSIGDQPRPRSSKVPGIIFVHLAQATEKQGTPICPGRSKSLKTRLKKPNCS